LIFITHTTVKAIGLASTPPLEAVVRFPLSGLAVSGATLPVEPAE
jgi:hypothetical protein